MLLVKEVLGALATAIAVYGYVPYLRDTFRGRTKPHAFSWLVWGLMTGIGFVAQVVEGGGAGTWVMGFTALACGVIFVSALFLGEKDITRLDWLCLAGAAVSILLWIITDDPLLSVILITVIDVFGCIPTFRKSYSKPYEETLVTYVLSSVKSAFGLLALQRFTVVTALYPFALVVINAAFVMLFVVRRRQLGRPADQAYVSTTVPEPSA
jgi:hypothetical protein